MAQPHVDAQNKPSADSPADAERQEIAFDEAIARYYGEWVLMKITEFNEHHEPVKGYLIAHSPRRGDLSEALKTEPPKVKGSPYQPYYPFKAFPRTHVGETLEQAFDRFTAQRAAARQDRRAERS